MSGILALLTLVALTAWPHGDALARCRVDRASPVRNRVTPTSATTTAEVAHATDLLVLTLRAGSPVVQALAAVSSVVEGAAAADLRRVEAAYRWGFTDVDAWAAAPPLWAPLASAVAVAQETGIPVAALWEAAAAELRTAETHRRTVAAAKLGTHLVLPLGLTFLPAFMATTLVPLVVALARTATG